MATDYLTLFRFVGLMPGREYHQWCRRAAQLAANAEPQYAIDLNQRNAARAFSLLERGHYNEAADIYRYEFAANWQADVDQRFVARVLTERAELSRRRGELPTRLDLLLEAERAGRRLLEWRPGRSYLDGASQGGAHKDIMPLPGSFSIKLGAVQRAAVNVVGEARTLMLMARIEKHVVRLVDPELSQSLPDRVQRICSDRTALRVCPLAQKILSHWDLWTGGYHLSGERDACSGGCDVHRKRLCGHRPSQLHSLQPHVAHLPSAPLAIPAGTHFRS